MSSSALRKVKATLQAGLAARPRSGLRGPLRLAGMAATGALLIGLLILLYQKSQGPDPRRQDEILGYLRELKAIDGRQDLEVLRSRTARVACSGPATDQDAGAASLLQRLRAAGAATGSPALDRGLPEFILAAEDKSALLVRHREAAAVVCAALARIEAFDAEVAGLVRGAWPSVAQRDRLVALESTAALLLAQLLRYAADPGEAGRATVESFAADLRAAGAGMPAALREGLARIEATTQQVLGAKPVEDELFRKIMMAPAGPRIDSLAEAFSAEIAASRIDGERYRIYLIAYAAALLVLIGWLLSRLALSYRLLESRVEQRTRELSAALAQLKASEAQLIQSEKMSSLGQMVAGIAHEINTPLAYVKNSLGSVAVQLPEVRSLIAETHNLLKLLHSGSPDPARLQAAYLAVRGRIDRFAGQQSLTELGQLAGDGLHGIEQISEIVLNLKNFSRLDRSKVSSFNLNEGLRSALLLARHELRQIHVDTHFGDIPPVTCSPSQLNQVFLNLITNAAQAVGPAGGRITLCTRRADAGHVAVDVADNGCGIEPAIMPRIFDPFFTTKPVGEGTGLGLSIAYKIIEQHGGSITVDSTPGSGTTFTVLLPLVPPAVEVLP